MKVEGEGARKEKMFRSIRVDPETSNLLEKYNVNFKGEIESDFLPRLLSLIVPTEDRFLMNKTELLTRIATLLGGRAAEEIIFNDISTEAHNDLSRAPI